MAAMIGDVTRRNDFAFPASLKARGRMGRDMDARGPRPQLSMGWTRSEVDDPTCPNCDREEASASRERNFTHFKFLPYYVSRFHVYSPVCSSKFLS